MAIFYGTGANDRIAYFDISSGVTSDPAGLITTTDDGDTIFGYGGNDTLDGAYGDDTVYGGDGDDAIHNDWGGFDFLFGEAGNDVISAGIEGGYVDGGTGNDSLYGGNVSSTVLGGHGNDYVGGGIANDLLVGSAGADYIFGDNGADLLRGGSGNDTLMGDYFASSHDILIGGAGADVFIPWGPSDSTPAAFDLIRGEYSPGGAPAFEGEGVAGGDTLDLSQIDAIASTDIHDHFLFGGKSVGHLWLTEAGTRTLVLGNMGGDDTAEFKMVIDDGAVRASEYWTDDFVL